jgi:hypothetical protein
VNWGRAPLLVDPGSYLYTPDPIARNAFRSTAVHNTVQCDGREQAPLPPVRRDQVFCFRGPVRPCRLEGVTGSTVTASYRHASGYVHRRTVRLLERALTIEDRVTGAAPVWTFQFAPDVRVDGNIVTCGGARIRFDGPALEWDEGWVSPCYGARVRAPRGRHRASRGTDHRAVFTFEEVTA